MGGTNTTGPAPSVSVRWISLLAVGAALSAWLASWTLGGLAQQPAGVDFLPVWTAGRMAANVYDFAAITDAQRWLIGNLWTARPFIYPPSMLLLVAPFAALGFWAGYACWTMGSASLYLWIVARSLPGLHALLLVFLATSRPFLLAAFAGQPGLLIAALIVAALGVLDRRPVLAGVLLGAAAMVKPTLLAFAPVCLLAGGHYRALLGAAAAAAAIGAASVLSFGLDTWAQWLSALGWFQSLVSGEGYLPNMITPTAAALLLGVDGPALLAARAVFWVAAAVIAWTAFRTRRPLEQRLAAMVGSGLLVSPYAMSYDLVALAPAALIVLAKTAAADRWLSALAAFALFVAAAVPFLGPYAVAGFIALVLASGGDETNRSGG